ncbi:hypothetical protein Tco_0075822 [Tanacetum coccineum]
MFDLIVLDGEEVFIIEQEVVVSAATTTTATIINDITLAQALEEMKSTKPKTKGLLYKSWVNLQQQNLHNYLHNNHRTKVVKSPSIVDWKIHKEGRKIYYQIMRADGKSHMYIVFSHMLKSFDREDLEDLYKLVKAKYESTRLVEDLDLLLWGDLKTMFEPHVEDKSTFLDDATCAYLYFGREEVSPCTTYTFNDVRKEAYN